MVEAILQIQKLGIAKPINYGKVRELRRKRKSCVIL
jgi:hypothetical protein